MFSVNLKTKDVSCVFDKKKILVVCCRFFVTGEPKTWSGKYKGLMKRLSCCRAAGCWSQDVGFFCLFLTSELLSHTALSANSFAVCFVLLSVDKKAPIHSTVYSHTSHSSCYLCRVPFDPHHWFAKWETNHRPLSFLSPALLLRKRFRIPPSQEAWFINSVLGAVETLARIKNDTWLLCPQTNRKGRPIDSSAWGQTLGNKKQKCCENATQSIITLFIIFPYF